MAIKSKLKALKATIRYKFSMAEVLANQVTSQ